MSDRDALVLTLIRGLEGAATALDVVDDATRQQIGGLLSPKARRLLAALTAPAPPPPTARRRGPSPPSRRESGRARSHRRPGSPPKRSPRSSASPRSRLRRHELRRPPGGRARRLQRSFSDIKTLTCVARCARALRDAAAKLSPRLEHALVLKKFPLLGTVVKSPEGRRRRASSSARTRVSFGGARRRPARPEPTTALDAYTLSLELDVEKDAASGRRSPPPGDFRKNEIKSTSGLVRGRLLIRWTLLWCLRIPQYRHGVYDKVMTYMRPRMALNGEGHGLAPERRTGAYSSPSCSRAASMDVMDDETIMFDWENVPRSRRNKGLDWQRRTYSLHVRDVPNSHLFWSAESSHFSRLRSRRSRRGSFS